MGVETGGCEVLPKGRKEKFTPEVQLSVKIGSRGKGEGKRVVLLGTSDSVKKGRVYEGIHPERAAM